MPPPSDEITTGELGRRLDAFGTGITESLKDLAKKIDDRPDWQDVRRIEAGLVERVLNEKSTREAERLVADKAIKGLEEWNKYAVRSMLGLIAAVGTAWAVAQAVPGL